MWRGRLDELLQVHVGAGKGGAGFRLRLREQGGQLGGVADDAHAAPAAAGRGLQDDRVADARGDFQRLFGALAECLRSRAGSARRLRPWRRGRAPSGPSARITSGLGPMNLMPEVSQTSAKSAFSLRKP